MVKRALEGLKVCDFTWAAAGPILTKYLADFGATVVRIESTASVDVMRLTSPFKDFQSGLNRGGYFAAINPNKYSMALNLRRREGLELAKRLVAWSDIVVENFTAGVMERLGLGYEDLQKVKPDIIMLRHSNQGQTGPNRHHPGLGFMLAGLSGFYHFTGYPHGGPMPLPFAYTDGIGPRFAAVALLSALEYRARTGRGQCLDISQLEASVHMLTPAILDFVVNGNEGQRVGNTSPLAAPHGAYPCKGDDRWCVIAAEDEAGWRRLCELMGHPELAADARFATLEARKAHESELDGLVAEWTSWQDPVELVNLLQENGVAAGVVQSCADLVADPQLNSRDFLWMLDHAEIGKAPHYGEHVRLSETPGEGRTPAPCLGEHTEYVCREILGLSDEEFVELIAKGVLE